MRRPLLLLGLLAMLASAPAHADPALAAEVRTAIKRAAPALRRCHRKIPADERGLVELSFTIDPDGAVTQASAGPRAGKRLGRCVERVLRTLRFRARGTTVTVRYPLNVDPV